MTKKYFPVSKNNLVVEYFNDTTMIRVPCNKVSRVYKSKKTMLFCHDSDKMIVMEIQSDSIVAVEKNFSVYHAEKFNPKNCTWY